MDYAPTDGAKPESAYSRRLLVTTFHSESNDSAKAAELLVWFWRSLIA